MHSLATAPQAPAPKPDCRSPAEALRAILERPEAELDYARAKLAIDRLVDPTLDIMGVSARLDQLVSAVRGLAGPAADADARLAALRRLIYDCGPWNEEWPFGYDHSNVEGRDVRVKLLSHYLETRLGDCVSMPVLFLILADKLGLSMALAAAPNHLFLRWRRPGGRVVNLETTSGALPARTEWIRHTRRISDRAVASGMYLRSLTRREAAATMGTTLLQHLIDARRFEEAVEVSEVILHYNPRDGLTLANQGNAFCRMIEAEFLEKYRSTFLIPTALRPRYLRLLQRNHAAFAAAHALGWEHKGCS